MGCHGGIGTTRDGIFSFGRRLGHDAHQHGWYHWSQKSIKGLKDPLRKDGRHEHAFYLEYNHAGDEFRGNMEIREEFFTADGAPSDSRPFSIGCDSSMETVSHENMGMDMAALATTDLLQIMANASIVTITNTDWVTVITSLNNM